MGFGLVSELCLWLKLVLCTTLCKILAYTVFLVFLKVFINQSINVLFSVSRIWRSHECS